MFCGTDNMMWNIPILNINDGIFHKIMAVPHNTIMDMNNFMGVSLNG